ncbi:MAG: hypothetical protein ABSD90_12040 [Methylocystis sp.]|jgi:hypothetical protein
MSDYFFTLPIDNSRSLCISPLTREEARNGGGKSNGCGYFVYEKVANDDDLIILAQLVSIESAIKLYETLSACLAPST